MSSGTKVDDQGRRTSAAVSDKVMKRIARLGMSPRQQVLNHYWAIYRGQNYEARRIDWDGKERVDKIDHEAIATAGFIPPGFYDAGQMFPLKFRKPTAPYGLVKVIVDRFTGLLFSERRHPQIRVDGDPDTEDFVRTLAEIARLWPTMILARAYGGAVGSVAVGFQFVEGKPVIEVHDPRWLYPTFIDRSSHKLKAIEKRYIFPIEMKDPESGAWEEVPHWYRRIITDEQDVLWKPQPVGNGEEPDWENPSTVDFMVDHNLGFCPVVWVQNLPVVDDIDGDPDCNGVYDMVEAIDALIAQANRGIIANCDPTVHIATDLPFSELAKGSDNAIKTERGGSLTYAEISGTGPEAATKLAEDLRKKALEVAQCVLEHPDMANRTATEIERVYSSMLAKADILREQYGERCVKPILEMMVKAAKKVMQPRSNESGQIERGQLILPEKMNKSQGGGIDKSQRKLGPGGALSLQWPGYFEPVLTDVNVAVTAAVNAKAGGLIDDEHAIKFTAEYFRLENVAEVTEKIKKSEEENRQAMEQAALGNMGS